MGTRLLIIDKTAQDKIKQVIEYANNHPITLTEIKQGIAGFKKAVGDTTPQLVLNLADGFRVVYSVESQPSGLCRHLSVSVKGLGYPNPGHCNAILKEFGFTNQIGETKTDKAFHVWMEDKVRAVNFLEPL